MSRVASAQQTKNMATHIKAIDVANAQILGAREAEELSARIQLELDSHGVDASVNPGVYFDSNK